MPDRKQPVKFPSSPSYLELREHPQWQKRRLEILNKAGWKCEECSSTEKQLHVHHKYYEKGHKPWEYPDEALQSLCWECHEKITGTKRLLLRAIGELPSNLLEQVLGYTLTMKMEKLIADKVGDKKTITRIDVSKLSPADVPPINVYSHDMAQGIADCCSSFWYSEGSEKADLVLNLCTEGKFGPEELFNLMFYSEDPIPSF